MFAIAQTDTSQARSWMDSGFVFKSEKNWEACFLNFEKAAAAWKPASAWSELNDCYYEMGLAQRKISGLNEAAPHFDRAVRLADAHLPQDDLRRKKNYRYYGFIMRKKGNINLAIDCYKVVLQCEKRLKDVPAVAKTIMNIGNQYSRLGDYPAAIQHHSESLRLHDSIYGRNQMETARCLLNLGRAFHLDKAPEKALKCYQNCLQIRKSIGGKTHIKVAETYNFLYDVYIDLNLHAEALASLKEAEKIILLIPDSPKLMKLKKSTLKNQIDHHIHLHQIPEALAAYDKVMGLLLEMDGPLSRELATIYAQKAELLRDSDSIEQALNHYHRVLQIFYPTQKLKKQQTLPQLNPFLTDPWIMVALHGKASCFRKRYNRTRKLEDLHLANTHYLKAREQVHILRQGFISEKSLKLLTERVYQVYEDGITCLLELYARLQGGSYLQSAFYTMEKSKAISLMEVLATKTTETLSAEGGKRLEDLQLLEDQLAQSRQLEWENAGTPNETQQAKITFELTIKREKLLEQIREKHPLYHQLKYGIKSLSTHEIQAQLPDASSLVIEYFAGQENLILFAIGKDRIWAHQQPYPKGLDQQIAQLVESISSPPQTSVQLQNDFDTFCTQAYALYQHLIQPLEEGYPGDWSAIKKLTIIADGNLHHLPFEVLLNRKPDRSKIHFGALPYLLHQYEIHYAFSATWLYGYAKHKKRRNNGELLAYGLSFKAHQPPNNHLDHNPLSPLQHAAEEATKLTTIYKGKTVLEPEATVTDFKKRCPDYKVLHLATHTVINQENPLYSSLVFAPDGDVASVGHLKAWELYNLPIQADLVVLSACETGAGQSLRGEGVQSLIRGFGYAGCPSMVMSLWTVNDQAASVTMVDFYRELKNLPVASALHQSKLNYLKKASRIKAHPYYWATFVALGQNEKLNLTRSANRNAELIFVGSVLLFPVLLILMRRYKKTPSGPVSQ